MRILITGGFGFIGGRLARHFSLSGHQVVLGSRHAQVSPSWLPGAEVAIVRWHDEQDLRRICREVDVVIHAAGMNAQDCTADPVAALEFNGLMTARLLEAAIAAGVGRFVYMSTAHVYASPLVGLITEDICPKNLHPYATSHLAGENAVMHATQLKKIEGVVLRLSNAFGRPMHVDVNCWMLLVNDLCRQAALTGTMVLLTSGLQHRDFISMTEVSRVVAHLSLLPPTLPAIGAINVGSGLSMSVFDFAQLIQQRCKLVLGFEPSIKRLQPTDDEKHQPLEYHLEKLERSGYKVKSDYHSEIDSLLTFSNAAFNKPGVP